MLTENHKFNKPYFHKLKEFQHYFWSTGKGVRDSKSNLTYYQRVATDSEYKQRVNGDNLPICSQFVLRNKIGMIVEHPDFKSQRLLLPGEVYPDLPVWHDSIIPLLTGSKPTTEDARFTVVLDFLLYFAPHDLLRGMFTYTEAKWLMKNLKQDGKITVDNDGKDLVYPFNNFSHPIHGVFRVVISVSDVAKCGAPGGLEALAEGVGRKMLKKESMDVYKSDMTIPYLNPELFPQYYEYSMDDAHVLFDIVDGHMKRTRDLYEGVGLEAPEKERLSMGSMIAAIDIAYMEKLCEGYEVWKLISKRSKKGKKQAWELEDLLNQASVKYFSQKEDNSKASLALVQGGLAKNFQPRIVNEPGVFPDWDVAGAYFTMQCALEYPIGIPHTFGLHENSKEELPSLRKFLKQRQHELIPRLFVIVIDGSYDFCQSLIPSKVVDEYTLSERVDVDDIHIPGEFRLYTNQIINGILTSDVLDLMKARCTNNQWAEFLDKSIVKSAAWYPKSHRCTSPEEWYEASKLCGNEITEETDAKGNTIIRDTRTKFWYSFPIKNILNEWGALRKVFKNMKGWAGLKENETRQISQKESLHLITLGVVNQEVSELRYGDEIHDWAVKMKSMNDAKQTSYKLGNNTHYGVMASPLLPVANIVTANNITAMCRCVVWMAAMALGLRQGITDGGLYNINKVRFQGDKKASMDTLSKLHSPELLTREQRRSVIIAPLLKSVWSVESSNNRTVLSNGVMTIEGSEENWAVLDDLVTQHIKEFFKDDELPILDCLVSAHKDVYKEAVTHGQTNYRLKTMTGDPKAKARGYKVDKRIKGVVKQVYVDDDNQSVQSSIDDLFEQLSLNPESITPFHRTYTTQILKINQAKKMDDSKSKPNLVKDGGLLAGDSITKQTWLRPISLSMFMWKTDAQYQSWAKQSQKLKELTGYGLEQFFLNEDGTLNYILAVNTIQDRINEGDNWIKRGCTKTIYTPVANHPYLDNPIPHDSICHLN